MIMIFLFRNTPSPYFQINKEDEDLSETKRREARSKHRNRAAPNFVVGLEDMQIKAGDSAAVAGQLSKSEADRVLPV